MIRGKIALLALVLLMPILALIGFANSMSNFGIGFGDAAVESPLWGALDAKDIGEAKHLIRELSNETVDWNRILAMSIDLKDVELVQMVLDRGGKLDLALSEVSSLQQAQALIRMGANVNAINDRGVTPLQDYAYNGNVEYVKWFLEHGAHVNAVDKENKTALTMAVAQKAILKDLKDTETNRKYDNIIALLKAHGATEK